MRAFHVIFFIVFCAFGLKAQDSTKAEMIPFTIHQHIPKKATQKSALIPGWGQAYNKQYWKIPLVYGVLAIPVATFQYNADLYNKAKFAYQARYKAENGDPSDIAAIDPLLKNLSLGSLQSYRNIFRKDRDYSIMWIILAWGLNVVDATVSGHLKSFDINNNLSLKLQPHYQPQFKQAGLSLQIQFNAGSAK